MTKNNKGRAPNQDATPKTTDSRNHTGSDPLIGWFNLAKPSRNRQQKSAWKRRSRGWINPTMAADIVLLVIVALLILGVIHA